jgi:CheY-like chemotaxis protein
VLFKVGNSSYDIILCDFNLGEGRDGQQLLEELRHRGLISLDTAFVMVTAESVYEKVVATAELAPDDYMIKPFSAEVMRNRLENILLAQTGLFQVYRHFEANELEASIAACDEVIRETSQIRGGRPAFQGRDTQCHGPFPGGGSPLPAGHQHARHPLGAAWAWPRPCTLQKKDQEAEELLHDVLEKTPEMVAAYDLLADVRIAKKDGAGAQAALQQGVAISGQDRAPTAETGAVAQENGDLDTARVAFSTVLEKGQHSVFVSSPRFGNLCRVQLEQGDVNAAMDTLKKNKHTPPGQPGRPMVSAVVQRHGAYPGGAVGTRRP